MGRSTKTNIRQVAAHAGVSPATVSRALNGNVSVDSDLMNRVLASARELGYQIPAAPSRGRGNIVFIVPSLGNTYYSNVVNGALEAARLLSYKVILMVSNFDEDQELDCLNAANTADTIGLIFAPVAGRNPLKAVPSLSRLPIVISGPRHVAEGLPHVYINNEEAAYMSTRYLLRLGRRNIAFIAHFWSDHIHTYKAFMEEYNSPAHSCLSVYDRYDGYCRALNEVGLSPDPSLIAFGSYEYEAGYRCARQLLASSVGFDAVIAPNDRSGSGVLKLLREQGFQVPQQVSLVCLNGGLISKVVSPALTTVSSGDYEMGQRAVEQLDHLIKGEPAQDVRIDNQLLIKDSTQAMFR